MNNPNNLPYMYMMVGLPGSGKSYYASQISIPNGQIKVHSSDAIRLELFGDMKVLDHNEEVFAELQKRIVDDLENGISVVYDATNLNKKRRRAFLNSLHKIPCIPVCVMIMLPYEKCLVQNSQRGEPVPEKAIFHMLTKWQPPAYEEGWEEIIIVYPDDSKWKLTDLFDGENGLDNFDQQNKHHSFTLGQHCKRTMAYVDVKKPGDNRLKTAALLHDIGKVKTKTCVNTNGENDGEYHYYNHQNVSAYESIFYTHSLGFDDKDVLYISNLIYYHMHPLKYYSKEQNITSGWVFRERIDRKMYEDIKLLHEADKASQKKKG